MLSVIVLRSCLGMRNHLCSTINKTINATKHYELKTMSNASIGQSSTRVPQINPSSETNRIFQKYSQMHEPIGILARNFHLSPKPQIPPVAWLIVRPVMKITAILSGRAFRKWWQSLPKDKKAHFREAFIQSRTKILAAITGLTVLMAINYYAHIQEAPITGRKRFIAFTKSQYEKIARFERDLQMEMHKGQFLPNNHPAVNTVHRVASRLFKANTDIESVHSLKFTVSVINDDNNVNAFVLPTGDIFVFTGLLKTMTNDDQLSVVLGHEMAHAVLSHGAEQVSMARIIDVAVVVVLAMLWAFLPNDGLAVVAQWFYNKVVQIMLEMPYTRRLEREADEVGLLLASKACFDVREAPVFWTLLSVRDQLDDQEKVEWLSTHPSHESRAERLEELMPRSLNTRRECQCPMLPRKDPRDAIPEMLDLLKLKEKTQSSTTVPVVVTVPATRGALVKDRSRMVIASNRLDTPE